MILFICNHPFPASTGFANRCRNILELLRKNDTVAVLCRSHERYMEAHATRQIKYAGKQRDSSLESPDNMKEFSTANGPIPLYRFSARFTAIERTDTGNYLTGLYELLRALDLFIGMTLALVALCARYARFRFFGSRRGAPLRIYCVNAPLTVPLMVYALTRIFHTRLEVLEFHDLEPEMARHIKSLPKSSFVLKVEYFLEAFLTRKFKKVVVTNQTQKEIIIRRTGKPAQSVFVLPNSPNPVAAETSRPSSKSQEMFRHHYGISPNCIVVSYSGNLTYDYTISGVLGLLERFPHLTIKHPDVKLVLAGDGDGLLLIQEKIMELSLTKSVVITGRIAMMSTLFSLTDIALVPWHENEFSATILPTKLLEYMAWGRAIIAPDFGEFSRVLENRRTALLYRNDDELISRIEELALNPELRARLGAAARDQYHARFALRCYAAEFEKFIC